MPMMIQRLVRTGVLDISWGDWRIFQRVRPWLPYVWLGFLMFQAGLFMVLVSWDLPSGPASALQKSLLYGGLAVAPGLALGYGIYFKDRHYKESLRLLGRIFVYAGISGSLAGFVNTWVANVIGATVGWDTSARFLYFFAVVAPGEELVKFFVVYMLVYRTGAFKQVYDGMLFCGASALGFATVENVLYVFTSGDEAIDVALLRAVLSVPGHLSYGLLMGYGMGRARAVQGRPEEKEWLVLGLGAAIVLHGAYNFMLVVGPGLLMGLFVNITGWYASYRAMKAGLRLSPFTRCGTCTAVMPQLSAFCPNCRTPHAVALNCLACSKPLDRWSRKCPHCSTRVRLPWHLQIQRVKDLYPQQVYQTCPSCGEGTPSGMNYCLHCGTRLNLPQRAVE